MHNIIFIRRRFPKSYRTIIAVLFCLSLSALAIGVGLLLLTRFQATPI
jgi:hypothetical protein